MKKLAENSVGSSILYEVSNPEETVNLVKDLLKRAAGKDEEYYEDLLQSADLFIEDKVLDMTKFVWASYSEEEFPGSLREITFTDGDLQDPKADWDDFNFFFFLVWHPEESYFSSREDYTENSEEFQKTLETI